MIGKMAIIATALVGLLVPAMAQDFDDDNDDNNPSPSTSASSGARCFRWCTRGSWSSDRITASTGRLHHPEHNVH